MAKFKVGDTVVVTNEGRRYSSFDRWLISHAPNLIGEYLKNNTCYFGDFGEVIKVGSHLDNSDKILCLVRTSRSLCLINEEGLKLAKRGEDKMDKLLDVELHRYGKLLYGKILHQDESLRGKRDIIKDGEYKINSIYGSELDDKTLFINGSQHNGDYQEFSYRYKDEEQAKEALIMFTKLINKLNEINGVVTPMEAIESFITKDTGIKIVMPDGTEYVNPFYFKLGCFMGGSKGIDSELFNEGKWYILDKHGVVIRK